MTGGVTPLGETLERVLTSTAFSRSKRHAGLLQFLAAQPPGAEIKETILGHEFFGRPPGYDPKLDPVVRVEVRRLRERLQTYYDSEGIGDPWRLEIPKGAYELKLAPAAGSPAVPAKPQSRFSDRTWWRLAAGLLAAIVVTGALWWRISQPGHIGSIAVLPLTITTAGDPATAAAAGLSREITGELSRIAGLRVVGPEASARAEALTGDLREIARRLDVDAILSGAVRVDGERLLLQVQLSSGKDRAVIWARTLERDVVDPFSLQDELAASVAAAIHRDLLRAPSASRPVSGEALLQYRQGQLLMDRRSAPSIRQAIERFRSVTAASPLFAGGWAALADALATYPNYGSPESGWVEEARAAGRKAIALDRENADGYAALGWIEFASDLRAATATRLLTKALELNPNLLPAHRRLAMVQLAQGRFREAEQRLLTARRLDALSPMVGINFAELYFYEGNFAREETELRAVLALNPNFIVARMMLANILPRMKRCGEATPLARQIIEDPDGVSWRGGMAAVLAQCGDLSVAREIYNGDPASPARQAVAEFFGDWPLLYQFLDRMGREQPDFLCDLAIGPDGARYAKYPPIRMLFDRVTRQLRQLDQADFSP
jgi:TolB-like protein/Flp pilus assembly protein TadD